MAHTHDCPGGCGKKVSRHRYACKRCWYRLPEPHRLAIQINHRHNTEAHSIAMWNARNWYCDNPLSIQDSADA